MKEQKKERVVVPGPRRAGVACRGGGGAKAGREFCMFAPGTAEAAFAGRLRSKKVGRISVNQSSKAADGKPATDGRTMEVRFGALGRVRWWLCRAAPCRKEKGVAMEG